jgi:hypothetical protein
MFRSEMVSMLGWMAVDEQALARKFAALWPHLNERQRRLWLGVEA